jgi:hypothetical protein
MCGDETFVGVAKKPRTSTLFVVLSDGWQLISNWRTKAESIQSQAASIRSQPCADIIPPDN